MCIVLFITKEILMFKNDSEIRREAETRVFKRLITEIYPSGLVSIVSDTFDFWGTLSVTAPSLKAEIMAREGKVVFRPDSGDPVKIICGDPEAVEGSNEWLGAVRVLDKHFGST